MSTTDLATELLGKVPNKAERRLEQLMPDDVALETSFIILGQPCSKANSRKIVTLSRGKPNERTAVVKSAEALAYERDALRQIPRASRLRLQGPVCVTLRLFYLSELSDLDESLVLDVMQDRYALVNHKRVLVQDGVYRNDRQVREKHVYHGLSRFGNPRAEITVRALTAQQAPLL